MPRKKKPKKIPKDRDVMHGTAIAIGVLIDKSVDFIVKHHEKQKSQPTPKPKPEPSPKPQEAEKVVPPLPTVSFIQNVKTDHERLEEQKKAGTQFLKRLN